ncbi:hypothetical protein [Fulvimonas yonginensis]|uniref:Uncharacterized protein n=1 Tax=Fulvimonas yonginensis TaxID=1495200 RepID=A0ABU8JA95_9GAMM
MNAAQRRVNLRRLRREVTRLGLKPNAWQWGNAYALHRLIKWSPYCG